MPPGRKFRTRKQKRRRRVWIRRMLIGSLLVIALGLLGAGARYARHRSCARRVESAKATLASVSAKALRLDLTAHLRYLEARIAKGWLYRKRDFFLGGLSSEVAAIEAAIAGTDETPHRRPGHHVIVTVSAVDGAHLRTAVHVPTGWDGESPLPLALILHAGGVTEMIDCFPAPAHDKALTVMPLARGSHDYLGVQMTAVEECVRDVKSRYPTGKLVVLGSSQGGMGAWLYAQRHAAEVAGVSPWAGNADPAGWEGKWERSGAARSPAGRAAALVRAARSPIARTAQLATDPPLAVYVGHGTDDDVIPHAHSESMVAALRASGAEVRYETFAGETHYTLPPMTAGRIDWLFGADGRKQGARGLLIVPPLTFAPVMRPDDAHYEVIDPRQEARVSFGGGETFLANAQGERGEVPVAKWFYPGPAGAAFDEPFAFVLPGDTPAHLTRCFEEFAARWRRRFGGEARRLRDEAEIEAWRASRPADRRRTLVYLGRVDPVRWASESAPPVRVSDDTVILLGRTFKAEDIGVIVLRQTKPLEGALCVWGSTPAAYAQLWDRFGHAVDWEGDRGRWWFDYAVFDRRTAGPDTFLAAGFFHSRWSLSESLLFKGSAAPRAELPGTNWPTGEPAPAADGGVWLSSIPPESAETVRGAAAFDRAAGPDGGPLRIQGKEFMRGIGVAPPAVVRWNIGGAYETFSAVVGTHRVGDKYPIRHRAERPRFEVWGDGRLLTASPALSAMDGPHAITANVRGVKTLELRTVPTTSQHWHYGPAGWGDAKLLAAP